ncbi:GntR family transcriptional regulator [Streptosporangium saharense]|uniref:GntR family transcriptional regulator n=1 Tax=Streptosporangium saharense TaxID=1706840 RepID=UPI0033231266
MRGHAYEHVAAELREAILRGDLPAGSRLPRHADLAQRYGVSEIVIRKAIDDLKGQGLVETRGRGGTIVRERPPVRRISMDRYLADAGPQTVPQTSFTRDAGIGWSEYRLDKAYQWISTDPRLADLFAVEPGTRVLERRFVFYANGLPSQMSRSCLLADDVEGTALADPKNEPWPGGNIAQLRTLNIEVDEIFEETTARMSDTEESTTLDIGSGIPVFSIVRRTLSQGRVVEVADPIVIPSDRAIRVDRIVLKPELEQRQPD